MKKYILFILFLCSSSVLNAKEYNASIFGIIPDGVTNNTSSIQKAIDYINKKGGGTLVFYVGRYVTGTVRLRSNVYLRLGSGAVIAGTSSPYDYPPLGNNRALIVADNQVNIGISGKGVIEGSGNLYVTNARKLLEAGYIKEKPEHGLIVFSNCANISIGSLNLWNGPYRALALENCEDVTIDGTHIDGKNITSSTGVFLKNCQQITIRNVFVKVKKEPIITINSKDVIIKQSITDSGEPLSHVNILL